MADDEPPTHAKDPLHTGVPITLLGPTKLDLSSGRIKLKDYPNARHVGQMSTESARRLAEYDLHYLGLKQALDTLELLERLAANEPSLPATINSDSVKNVLWCGIVIAYLRSFDGNQRHALDADTLFASPSGALPAHQFVKDLRNKHFGHDVNNSRQSVVSVILGPEGDVIDIGHNINVAYYDGPVLRNLRNLITAALHHVNAERSTLEATVRAEAEAMTAQDRFKLPPPVLSPPKRAHKPRPR